MRRSRLAYLPLVFPLLAFAEFLAFVSVANAIGFFWAALLLAAFSVTGIVLLRREGVRGFRAFQDAARAGRPPAAEVTNSLIGLSGGMLLALPGFITGVVGLIALLPPSRVLIRRGIERAAERRLGGAATGDLFGPRRVRVHQSDPVTVVVDEQRPTAPAAIEGEIVR